MKEVRTRSDIMATVRIPGSKSMTHRALICAALAAGESRLRDVLFCEDTDYTLEALETLGAAMTLDGADLLVAGTGGRLKRARASENIFLGNAGTSMRLFLSVVSLGRGEFLLDGSPRMRERPVGELVKALNGLGADLSFPKDNGYPPVLVRARGIRGGAVRISGRESSQYISSLLLAAPYAEEDTQIIVSGPISSSPYVYMTLQVMEAFGASVSRKGYEHFSVRSKVHYRPTVFVVEADASSASYFWAAAAVSGGSVTTENVDPFSSSQGDMGFLDILEKMGCGVRREPDGVTVQGAPLKGVEVDMLHMPDMVPTLAAVALFAKGGTVIRNVAHLRLKESDRLSAICLEWSRLGAHVKEMKDGLVIEGGHPLKGALLNPHDDHRLAMSMAVIGLGVPGMVIQGDDCVKKSFPNFWEMWDRLG
ncbi:MAG: 3-phosphoshikimate 1-carboxyvinyltransferase [Desulfatiglandaceae bacterium]|jgi:3-phosphoshikimate 1-carboxyvinyltransferase